MAQSFDAGSGELKGEPFSVAEQIPSVGILLYPFSVSSTGVLAYRAGAAPVESRLIWFDRGGKQLEALAEKGQYRDPSLAPDGKRLAVVRLEPELRDIWLIDLARKLTTRFTATPETEFSPAWSHDGSRILYSSSPFEKILSKPVDGGGGVDTLLEAPGYVHADDSSRDGRHLAYSLTGKDGIDLWILPLQNPRAPFPLLRTKFVEHEAKFSPDSRWIAYASNESGRFEIYVQRFQGDSAPQKWRVSSNGGQQPRWREDGKEIYFVAPDGKLMAVSVGAGAALDPSPAVVLFQSRILQRGVSATPQYVVTANGQRFLINTLAGDPPSPPMTVVLNWTESPGRK
jgi:dipeptidyl aminopeptidase/acylaminoacyl peptidase